MELATGAIVEGKVTGITKFGAFVSLPEGRTGMVHISEIAHAYVSDINEYLTVGQEVQVKIIAIDPAGKINLSIKKCTEPPQRPARTGGGRYQNRESSGNSGRDSRESAQRRTTDTRRSTPRAAASKEPQSFDDMLKQFMADSDSKISSIKQYSDHRTKRGRRN